MIILHLFLVLERLRRLGSQGEALARALTETFVTDMDDCLREMGVGDLSVPRKVKRAAAELRASSLAYRRAIAAEDGALAAELASAIPGLAGPSPGAITLARYMRAAADHLDALTDTAVLAGRATFPPADFPTHALAPETAR